MSSHIRVVKRKATGFFKPQDLPAIKQAVSDVHSIMSNASILVRAFYLDWFEKSHPLGDGEKYMELNKDHLTIACNVVQGDNKVTVRSANQIDKVVNDKVVNDKVVNDKVVNDKAVNDKVAVFNSMKKVYERLYKRLDNVKHIKTNKSLSHILAYSITNLLTAYENNIHAHFSKYPKRFIRCDLLSKGYDKQTSNRLATKITNHYLYDAPLDDVEALPPDVDPNSYNDLFPMQVATSKGLPRCWDLKVYPWIYLYKMVQINQSLETEFNNVLPHYRKLLNPLPFHSSFVPMHIRLDTSGLSQLLMSKERIDEFKIIYEFEHPGTSLNMKTKSDMLSSFEKLFGRKALSRKEDGTYASDLWSYITNLKTCRQWKEINDVVKKNDPKHVRWVFDNAIVTDGVSISFQVIDEAQFGRKTFEGRKNAPKPEQEEPDDFRAKEKHDELFDMKKLSCDPGKNDILAINDGLKTIAYTKGQRAQDTFAKARKKETLKKRKKAGVEDIETQLLNRHPKKSCLFDTFARYASMRKRHEGLFLNTYSHPLFRQFKFTFHCKAKGSEHKFANKVFNTFGPSSTSAYKHCITEAMKQNLEKVAKSPKDIVIGWGNWGRNPNALKGIEPTPGIGIRRHFESFFRTETVDERLTSQGCPCCKGERNLKTHKPEGSEFERHHLLRCTNESCQSRWWNRNVAGSFNILSRFLDSIILPRTENLGIGRRRRPPKSRT